MKGVRQLNNVGVGTEFPRKALPEMGYKKRPERSPEVAACAPAHFGSLVLKSQTHHYVEEI